MKARNIADPAKRAGNLTHLRSLSRRFRATAAVCAADGRARLDMDALAGSKVEEIQIAW